MSGNVFLKSCVAMIAAITLIDSFSSVRSQEVYPSRAITLIVPFPQGGPSHTLGKALASEMSKILRQPVEIKNISGDSGAAGMNTLARSAPDGYTVSIGTTDTNATSHIILKDKVTTSPASFAAVGLIGYAPSIIIARKTLPAKSFTEFLAQAKRERARLKLGYAVAGTSSYRTCLLLMFLAGKMSDYDYFKGAHFRSERLALDDAARDGVDIVCVGAVGAAIEKIRNGELRALVVAGDRRIELLPDVPNSTELGVQGFLANTWYGLFGPKGMPEDALKTLSTALTKALASETVSQSLRELAITAAPAAQAAPAFLDGLVQKEAARFQEILKLAP
jgi:tripartite-type tricarboxylate transporter receptor subunit TctC